MVRGAEGRGPVLRTDREGIALLVVVLVTMVVGAIAAGAALIGANSFLISEYDQKSSLLESVADAGLELGRARLNADPGLFSDTAIAALEVDAAVYDADGRAIPGVTRTVYALPVGGGAGEYGNYGSLVAIARDAAGTRMVRRLDLLRESFAIFAYFTDYEPSDVAFGNQDELYGPVHSNSTLRIRSSGAVFHGRVTTAGIFEGAEYADFHDDTASAVLRIPMPTASQLDRMAQRAEPAGLVFTAPGGSVSGAQSTIRLDFVARDVDGDGVKEGFVRVYTSGDGAWLTASRPAGYASPQEAMAASENCGYFDANGAFISETSATGGKSTGGGQGHEKDKAQGQAKGHSPPNGLLEPTRQCFLGGSEVLTTTGAFDPTDEGRGQWLPYPGSVAPAVAFQPDGNYLFPLDRRLNPGFRGVIFVRGSVVVSGTVRSRVTVAATGDIILGDDLVYDTDPGAGSCTDIAGLFAGGRVIVADNTINAPQQVDAGSTTYYDLDDTDDEFIHATILALDRFEVENPGAGATAVSVCGTDASGNPLVWGRGCLRVTGGIIQRMRGIVTYGGGTGYVKRYTHDTCAFTAPPPYFPSTGHFYRGRYYEVDPAGFDIRTFFDALN